MPEEYPNHPQCPTVLPRTDASRSSPALIGAVSNGGQPDAPVNNAPPGRREDPLTADHSFAQTAHAGPTPEAE